MYIDNGKYHVTDHLSCFTSRNNATTKKRDVIIQRQSDHGAKHLNGKRYTTIAILALEDKTFIRGYEAIPDHVLQYAYSLCVAN